MADVKTQVLYEEKFTCINCGNQMHKVDDRLLEGQAQPALKERHHFKSACTTIVCPKCATILSVLSYLPTKVSAADIHVDDTLSRFMFWTKPKQINLL